MKPIEFSLAFAMNIFAFRPGSGLSASGLGFILIRNPGLSPRAIAVRPLGACGGVQTMPQQRGVLELV